MLGNLESWHSWCWHYFDTYPTPKHCFRPTTATQWWLSLTASASPSSTVGPEHNPIPNGGPSPIKGERDVGEQIMERPHIRQRDITGQRKRFCVQSGLLSWILSHLNIFIWIFSSIPPKITICDVLTALISTVQSLLTSSSHFIFPPYHQGDDVAVAASSISFSFSSKFVLRSDLLRLHHLRPRPMVLLILLRAGEPHQPESAAGGELKRRTRTTIDSWSQKSWESVSGMKRSLERQLNILLRYLFVRKRQLKCLRRGTLYALLINNALTEKEKPRCYCHK